MTDLPSAPEVAVATHALRNEATEWENQSAKLGELSTTVGGMEFGRLEAGLFQLMVGPYNDVVRLVAARCREGAAAMNEIGGALRAVADTYDAEDRSSEHRIRNVY